MPRAAYCFGTALLLLILMVGCPAPTPVDPEIAYKRAIEDAAILCGAHPWEARLRVTLPAISHGIFAGAIFSFLVSWDEVVVAIFMARGTGAEDTAAPAAAGAAVTI